MAEKAGVAYLYLIICELCELCEQMPSVYFFRKVSIFLGKVAAKAAKRRSSEAEYKRPLLPPAAYPERELRCVVCWLLIISADI